MQQEDIPIQIHVDDTNAEAMKAKVSAIKCGYFQDQFAQEFVKENQKKDVIIHRGYWCRFHIFNRIVAEFIEKTDKPQIISLGCGYDTMPYLMMKRFPEKDFKFIEIDLPQVVKRKIVKIKQSTLIKSLFKELDISDQVIATRYGLFGCDLTDLGRLKNKLNELKLDYKYNRLQLISRPTMVFAECVLTYIEPESTNKLLNEFRVLFSQLSLLNYEMFNSTDQFGKMMVKNFEYRGCPLPGIEAFPSMQSQVTRLQQFGYIDIQIEDMKTLYQKGTDKEERTRIEKLEMMDEWEEWNIMQAHYFVSLAHNYSQELISLKM